MIIFIIFVDTPPLNPPYMSLT